MTHTRPATVIKGRPFCAVCGTVLDGSEPAECKGGVSAASDE